MENVNKYRLNCKLLIESRRQKQITPQKLNNTIQNMLNQFNFIESNKTEELILQQNLNKTQQIKFMEQEQRSITNSNVTKMNYFKAKQDKFAKNMNQLKIEYPPLIINIKQLNVKQMRKPDQQSRRKRFITTQEKYLENDNTNNYIKLISQTRCVSNTRQYQNQRLQTFCSWSRKSSDNLSLKKHLF
ncbi:unnamed protein product [Paramecium pentaurelia]|uniref:Uncharacterized protein n=1 Tax=Paramecium pentaurelia TaxID=43138 RepID=A0A8S1TV37_9CILI|nr:unnamed protein product [Paramecium pentaurelia]